MLTDTGTVLLEKAQALLLEFDNIIQCIRDTENLKTGKITLGVPMLISFLYFCDIILDFKNQYPGVNMDIIEIGDDAIVEKVKEGSVDIGIVSRPLNGPELVSLPIFTDEVDVYKRQGSNHARRPNTGSRYQLYPKQGAFLVKV